MIYYFHELAGEVSDPLVEHRVPRIPDGVDGNNAKPLNSSQLLDTFVEGKLFSLSCQLHHMSLFDLLFS